MSTGNFKFILSSQIGRITSMTNKYHSKGQLLRVFSINDSINIKFSNLYFYLNDRSYEWTGEILKSNQSYFSIDSIW